MAQIGLTPAQTGVYFRAAAKAAARVGEGVETYRKRVMREECGVDSMKRLNRTRDFDRVMARFYADAEDFAGAASVVASETRRLRHAVLRWARELTAGGAAEAYVAGVLVQARLATGTVAEVAARLSSGAGAWEDYPAETWKTALVILAGRANKIKNAPQAGHFHDAGNK